MNAIINTPELRSVWDVFGDPADLFTGFARPARRSQESGALVPAVDVTENDHEYLVKAELPGVKKEDLDVTIHDGMLTINAETNYENKEKENGRIIRQERHYGKFVRSMRLGDGIDVSKVNANYKDGVLTLKLPKTEVVKPKKIDVSIA